MEYSRAQRTGLILLRLFIGWHFLYEGILKVLNPSWTAQGYLMSSQGFFKSFFTWLGSDGMIGITDSLNIALLIIVGLTLILGIFEKFGAAAGAILLLLFYLSHPAFPGMPQGPAEGSYYIINKNLIEMAALIVLYNFNTSQVFGLKMLLGKKEGKIAASAA